MASNVDVVALDRTVRDFYAHGATDLGVQLERTIHRADLPHIGVALLSRRAADADASVLLFFVGHALVHHAVVVADVESAWNASLLGLSTLSSGDDGAVVGVWARAVAAYFVRRCAVEGGCAPSLNQLLELLQPELLLAVFEAMPDQLDACTALGFARRNAVKVMLRNDVLPVLFRLLCAATTATDTERAAGVALKCVTNWLGSSIASVQSVVNNGEAIECVQSSMTKSPALFEAAAGVLVSLIAQRNMVTTALLYSHDGETTGALVDAIVTRVTTARGVFDAALVGGNYSLCMAYLDVVLAIVERHPGYVLQPGSVGAVALVDVLLHCTRSGSLHVVELCVSAWMAVAEHATDVNGDLRRVILERAIAECCRRCVRNGSDGVNDDDVAQDVCFLRVRVAELLCAASAVLTVESVLSMLVELCDGEQGGGECALELLAMFAPTCVSGPSEQLAVLICAAFDAVLDEDASDVHRLIASLSAIGSCARILLVLPQQHSITSLAARQLTLLHDSTTSPRLHEPIVRCLNELCFHCASLMRVACSDVVVAARTVLQDCATSISAEARGLVAHSCTMLVLLCAPSGDDVVGMLRNGLISECHDRIRAAVRRGTASQINGELLVLANIVNLRDGQPAPSFVPTAALSLLQLALECADELEQSGWLRRATGACDGLGSIVINAVIGASQSVELSSAAVSLIQWLVRMFVARPSAAWLTAAASVLCNIDTELIDMSWSLRLQLISLVSGELRADGEIVAAQVRLARVVLSSQSVAQWMFDHENGVGALESCLETAIAFVKLDARGEQERDVCELIGFLLAPLDLQWCGRCVHALLISVLVRANSASRRMCELLFDCLASSLPINAQSELGAVFGDSAVCNADVAVREKCATLIWSFVALRQRTRFAALLKDIGSVCGGSMQPDVLLAYELQ